MIRTFGLVALGAEMWQSTTDDPQFEISFGLVRPTYCLIECASAENLLDPIIYFDRGRGFSEHETVVVPHARRILCIVALRAVGNVVKMRFDPATTAGKFTIKFRKCYLRSTMVKAVGRFRVDAVTEGHSGTQIIYVDRLGDHVASGRPLEVPVARRLIDHYRHVLRLAAPVELAINHASSALVCQTPLISIVVPTYNTPVRYLNDVVDSFRIQNCADAELIFTDDGSTSGPTVERLQALQAFPSITIVWGSKNRGIANATNRGIARARGTWVGFLDHDDALSPHALACIKSVIEQNAAATLIYTDEVITDCKLTPLSYHLKPAFDPVMLSGVNYINHFCLYRRDRLSTLGGLREGFDGSQDYDLLLRYSADIAPETIVHLPFPAYLWRRTESSYSTRYGERAIKNARLALTDHYHRQRKAIEVDPALTSSLHRPRLDLAMQRWPMVSVVIPTRNRFRLISRVIQDLYKKTNYPNFETIVVDNGSRDPEVLNLYRRCERELSGFQVDIAPAPFNFARQINRGIELAVGNNVLLLNNDVEVLSPEWLQEMVSCLEYPTAGIVGARLLYPNRTLQHAGVIVGLGNLAGHWFEGKPEDFPGPFGRLLIRQTVSAVTGACMLISRDCLETVGAFDAETFGVAYNDVDYCLRAKRHGIRTIWTPFATLVHHGSMSRGSDEAPRNKERFAREKSALMERHRTMTFQDPAFNPWYTRDRSDPGLAMLDELPAPRIGMRTQ